MNDMALDVFSKEIYIFTYVCFVSKNYTRLGSTFLVEPFWFTSTQTGLNNSIDR